MKWTMNLNREFSKQETKVEKKDSKYQIYLKSKDI